MLMEDLAQYLVMIGILNATTPHVNSGKRRVKPPLFSFSPLLSPS